MHLLFNNLICGKKETNSRATNVLRLSSAVKRSIEKNWRGLRLYQIQLPDQDGLNYNKFRNANKNWRFYMNLTHQREKELRMKREEHHQLVLANEALKRERQ